MPYVYFKIGLSESSWGGGAERSACIQVDKLEDFYDVEKALVDLKKNIEDRGLLNINNGMIAGLYVEYERRLAREEGVKTGKGKSEESFRLASDNNKLQERIAELECERKGFIKVIDDLINKGEPADDS